MLVPNLEELKKQNADLLKQQKEALIYYCAALESGADVEAILCDAAEDHLVTLDAFITLLYKAARLE